MTRFRRDSRLAIFAIVASLGVAVAAGAQPLADRLPETTAIYFGWHPTDAPAATRTAAMLRDDRFVSAVRTIGLGAYGFERDPAAIDVLAADLRPLVLDAARSDGCFAITDLSAGPQQLKVSAVLLLKLGAARKDFEQHLPPLHERLKARLGDTVHLMKVDDAWLWVKPDRHNKPQLIWGFVGDTFAVLWGDQCEANLKLLQNPPEKPLAGSAALTGALAELSQPGGGGQAGGVPTGGAPAPALPAAGAPAGGAPVLTTYVRTVAALELLKRGLISMNGSEAEMVNVGWPLVVGQTGLDRAKALVGTTDVVDGRFVSRTLLKTDGPPAGMLPLLAGPAVDDAVLRVVPPRPMAVAAWRLDLAKTYDQIRAAAIAVGGTDAQDEFVRLEKAAADNKTPVKDVLGPLGDQWVLFNAAGTGGFAFTGWTLVGTIDEPDKFAAVQDAIEQTLARSFADDHPKPVDFYEVDGVTVHYLAATASNGMCPAWARAGDKLVVALYPQLVEDAVRQLKADRSVLDDPAFAAARDRVGRDGPIAFVSGAEVTRSVYPVGLVLMTAFGSWGENPFANLLPSQARLLEYVGDDAASVKLLPAGLLVTRTSDNPLLSVATLASPAAWVAASLPELLALPDEAAREASAANLRKIWESLEAKAAKNGGTLPADLRQAVKVDDDHDNAELLDSPVGDAREGADYAYLRPADKLADLKDPDKSILAYDAADLQNGEGANTLYANGRVTWTDAATLRAAIEKDAERKPAGDATISEPSVPTAASPAGPTTTPTDPQAPTVPEPTPPMAPQK